MISEFLDTEQRMMRMSNGHGRTPDFSFSAVGADPEAIYNVFF